LAATNRVLREADSSGLTLGEGGGERKKESLEKYAKGRRIERKAPAPLLRGHW